MKKQLRENGALLLFLFIGYCIGHAVTQSPNQAQVMISQDGSNLESGGCAYCGYDPNFCLVNYSRVLPSTAEPMN